MNPIIAARAPLRTAVRQVLLERLLSGELEPGRGINESRLAEELGVSRTPLREALLELTFEGFVESEQGKGFSVKGLSAETAWDLYLLVGWLEGVALRNAGLPEDSELAGLQAIDAERMEARNQNDIHRTVELDARWHASLISGCSNRECQDILKLLRRRLYRYEYVFADDLHQADGLIDTRVAATLEHHKQIMDALANRNLEFAVELLKHHWRTGAEIRSEWLRSNNNFQDR